MRILPDNAHVEAGGDVSAGNGGRAPEIFDELDGSEDADFPGDFDDFDEYAPITVQTASRRQAGDTPYPDADTAPLPVRSAPEASAASSRSAKMTSDAEYRRQANILSKVTGTAKALVKEPVVVVSIVILLIIVMFVRAFLVPSASMRPTLMEGDRILSMARYFPNGHTYAPGDIVCFMERHTNQVYVKRVVACGGDVVEITGEKVNVNGELSPYQGTGGMMAATRIELADDEYWVMGDNRGNSQDSRFIGPVKADQMISKVWCVYWPLNRFAWFGF